MPKIKTRETHKDIKVLDKASVAGERMKNAFIRSKDTAANLADDGQITPEEYAEDRVQYAAEDLAHDAGHTVTDQGKKLAQRGRDAVRDHRGHQKEPKQTNEPTAEQPPAQEAARRSAIHQAEERAAEPRQAEFSVERGEMQNHSFSSEVPEHSPPEMDHVQLVPQEATVEPEVSYSPSPYTAGMVQPESEPNVRGNSLPKLKTREGYEASAYKAETPTPLETKYRAQQLLKQDTASVSEHREHAPGIHEISSTEIKEAGPTFWDQPSPGPEEVRPIFWDEHQVRPEQPLSSSKVYTDHSHMRPVDSGKGIKTLDAVTPEAVPEMKQLTPTERGRQLAIKQAEQRAKMTRTEQEWPSVRPDNADIAPASPASVTAPRTEGAEPELPSVSFKNAETMSKRVEENKVKTAKNKSEQAWCSASAPRARNTTVDTVSDYAVMPSSYGQSAIGRREFGKAAEEVEKRPVKGTIKTAERTEKTIKQSARSTQKATVKTAQKTAKSSQKAIKTAEQTSKTAVKTAQATAKATQKSAQAAAKAAQKAAAAARETARAAAVAAKAVAKAVAAAVKAIIAGVKELVAAIAAGGWVAVVAIVLICLIGLILVSPFGIFFSGSNRDDGAVSASAAVARVSYDFASQLGALQEGDYDDIVISGSMADWPEVLAVFAVKVAGSEDVDAADVATLDPVRIAKLTAVFWDMNSISSEVETIDHPDSDPDDEVDDSWTESILHITITAKTAEDMKTQYRFSEKQKTMLDELLENRDALLELIGDLQYISADAESVMRHLPDDLSDERRKVVKTACSLVGKVNYFWGGKSLVIGWDPRWGTIQKVWADGHSTSGTYRPYGLDCSGFVDWVFYNMSGGTYVIGHGGGAASQHVYCRDITWDEAMPGDLVFYPGDEHVGIVGGWDESGNLLIIHCSAGVQITGASGFTSIARPNYYSE